MTLHARVVETLTVYATLSDCSMTPTAPRDSYLLHSLIAELQDKAIVSKDRIERLEAFVGRIRGATFIVSDRDYPLTEIDAVAEALRALGDK